jgi:hypothetical protein
LKIINALMVAGFSGVFVALALGWALFLALALLPFSAHSYGRRTLFHPKGLPVVLTEHNRRKTKGWKAPESETPTTD